MNRKKKIKTILKAKQKKANAKLQNSNKPKYISKAERAKIAEQQVLFSSTRLDYRPLIDDDQQLILTLFNQEDVLTNIGDKGIRTLEDAKNYINDGPRAMQTALGYSLYCCVLKETGEKVGISGLIKRNGIEHAEVGFAMLSQHGRKGYGLESTLAAIDYAKNELSLSTLQAITNQENLASQQLLEKAHFTFKSLVTLPNSEEEISLYERLL